MFSAICLPKKNPYCYILNNKFPCPIHVALIIKYLILLKSHIIMLINQVRLLCSEHFQN